MPRLSRIAVVSNDALGNYVVVTPLLQMLVDQFAPDALHYFGGTRTEELWRNEGLIDWGVPLFGTPPDQAIRETWRQIGERPYDLIVNVEASDWAKSFVACVSSSSTFVVGPSVGPDGRADLPPADDEVGQLAEDRSWTDQDLATRYPFLDTGFIGEIFCRLAYLKGPVPRYRLPRKESTAEIPDVLVSTAASSDDKLWPQDRWTELLRHLRSQGFACGLLGAKPSDQRRFWQGDETESNLVAAGLVQDLRGALTLPEVVGALAKAKLVLTIDNGILHLACSTTTPIVGLFRNGIHRLWAPPVDNLSVITPDAGRMVSDIPVQSVLEAIDCALSGY